MGRFQGNHALGLLVSLVPTSSGASAESSDVSGLAISLSDGVNSAAKDTVDIGQ